MSPFCLAQLRHLYTMMLAGEVTDTAKAARGLLGPAIADEERAAEVLADLGPVLDAFAEADAVFQAAMGKPFGVEQRMVDQLVLTSAAALRAWHTARAKLVMT